MMETWITDLIERFGYFSIFFLILCESVFPPIPSEVILTFGGFLTTKSDLSFFGVVAAATAGSVLGAIILYTIGQWLGLNKLEKFADAWGNYLGLKGKDIRKAFDWFKRYGYWAVFFCKMIPLIRSLISIPAGITKMKFGTFLQYTTVGTSIWNILLVWAGATLGQTWGEGVSILELYSKAAYILLALVIISVIYNTITQKREKR